MQMIRQKIDAFVYGRVIKSLMFTSRLGRRSTMGYADSGINFDHIYQNKPKGYTKLGYYVDKILLNLPACKATRARFDLIVKIIKQEISNNKKIGRRTNIVDLASGPARYLIKTISDDSADVQALCLDIDKRSVDFGARLAAAQPLLFKRANALLIGRHLKRLSRRAQWIPNLVVASGFYEYQPDEKVVNHFKGVYDHIEAGGLFLAILQYKNPNRKLIEKVGKKKDGEKWILYYRNPQQIEKWFKESGFCDIKIKVDKWNQYVFASGRKH